MQLSHRRLIGTPLVFCFGLSCFVTTLDGDFALAEAKSAKVAAKVVTVEGALLARGDGGWKPLKAGDAVADSTFLLALPFADFLSPNGAVQVRMLADVGERGPFPVMESGVVLKHNADVDLDLGLERGVIVLVNRKKSGAAKVRLHIRGEVVDMILKEPETTVVLEIYGRHAPGQPDYSGKNDDPTTHLFVAVIKGEVLAGHGQKMKALRAPPGPAILHWDSVLRKAEPQFLDTLPDNLKPLDKKELQVLKELAKSTAKLNEKDVGMALDGLLTSGDAKTRRVGVTCAAAVDDLHHLIGALADAKHADVRDHAILVSRHWLGREPGQVKKLLDAFVKEKYSPAHAKTIIHLLFGFTQEERGEPETYDVLISYLKHSKLPVRELARWHLVRLAPAGAKIAYDAAAPETERNQAFERWRALIPAGKLPPAPKK